MPTDNTDEERFRLTEHILATSESEAPEKTVARLLGDRQAPNSVTEAFVKNGICLSAEDYFGHDVEPRHELHFGGRVEHVPCVADALIAAELVDHEPVVVRSFDPVSGEPVVFEGTDGSMDVTPADAVVSLGMAEGVPESETMTSLTVSAGSGARAFEEIPTLICAYINAFEILDNYEQWAAGVEAKTVALPADKLLPVIRRFAASRAFEGSTEGVK